QVGEGLVSLRPGRPLPADGVQELFQHRLRGRLRRVVALLQRGEELVQQPLLVDGGGHMRVRSPFLVSVSGVLARRLAPGRSCGRETPSRGATPRNPPIPLPPFRRRTWALGAERTRPGPR